MQLGDPETLLKTKLGFLPFRALLVLLGTAEVEQTAKGRLRSWCGTAQLGGAGALGAAPPSMEGPGDEHCILLESPSSFPLVQMLVALVLQSPCTAMRIIQFQDIGQG